MAAAVHRAAQHNPGADPLTANTEAQCLAWCQFMEISKHRCTGSTSLTVKHDLSNVDNLSKLGGMTKAITGQGQFRPVLKGAHQTVLGGPLNHQSHRDWHYAIVTCKARAAATNLEG